MSIDVKKINEDFLLSEQTKTFALNFKWQQDYPQLWTLIQESSDIIYSEIYEKIANYVQNIRDIDFCNMHSLNSLLHEVGQEHLFSYDLAFPPELSRLMNILSISKNYMPEINRHLLSASVQSLCAQYMDSTAIPSFSGWNLFGPNGSTSVFEPSLSSFSFLSGITTVTKNWSTSGAISAEIGNDIVLPDSKYLMSNTTAADFLTEQLSSHLYAHTRDIDLLTVCGIIMPSTVSEADFIASLSFKQEAVYERWKEANQYIGFLDDIWPEPDPYKAVSYDSTTSATMISSATRILKDICVKTSYIRESLKKITRKYTMIGTAQSIQKNVDELIKRSFTKQTGLTNWRYSELPADKYSHLGAIGGYDVYATTSDTSAQALIETFSPLLSSTANLAVDVIEHYDKTEYMNIKALTPNVSGVQSFTTTYATSSWIDSNGIYQSVVVPVAIPTPVDTGTPSIQGGNPQYWDPAYVKFAKSNSEYTTADMHDYYASVGFTSDQLSAVDSWLISGDIDDYSPVSGLFLPTVWKTFATSGYYGSPTMPDLSGIPAPQYVGVNPTLIPADGWIIPPVDITVLQSTYIGTSAGYYPALNIKNQQFPTVASQTFVWNLVEKAFSMAPNINNSPLWSTLTDTSGDLRDSNGQIQHSWKFNAHEFHSYNTNYEESLNLNYKQVEDSRIDVDGPYKEDALSALLSAYMIGATINSVSGFYTQLGRYDLQFYNTNGVFNLYDRVYSQLNNWKSYIIDLSGQSPFENKNILSPSSYAGNTVVAFDADLYENQYTLFKKNSVQYETPGVLWMRNRSHPVSFPAMSGIVPGVTTSGAMLSILNSYGILPSALGSSNFSIASGATYYRVAVIRPEDGYEIAAWYPGAYAGNPYSNTLVIYDYMLMNLSVPYAISGMQNMFANCYDFFVDGDQMCLIGQSLDQSGYRDRIAVFSVAPTSINTLVSGDGATDDIMQVIANSTNSPQLIDLGAVGSITGYVGHYYTSNYINFVAVSGAPLATSLNLTVDSYNRSTNVFDLSESVTVSSNTIELRPYSSAAGQFTLSESKNLISIGYLNQGGAVTTIDFNKNQINSINYLVSNWSF